MAYQVESVTWQQAEHKLRFIREKVFVCEWRIPQKVEFDRRDQGAHHVLVYDQHSKEPVATGRLLPDGQISRVAVVMSARNSNAGKLVIDKLKEIASELNLKEVYIHSSLEALAYYKAHHFHLVGSVFMEAGIPRQRVACALNRLDIDQYYLSH
jgi:predicted GNAT family N-acyltransferase